jgi:hypothetical protein
VSSPLPETSSKLDQSVAGTTYSVKTSSASTLGTESPSAQRTFQDLTGTQSFTSGVQTWELHIVRDVWYPVSATHTCEEHTVTDERGTGKTQRKVSSQPAPAPPNTCLDPAAVNFGSALPCTGASSK